MDHSRRAVLGGALGLAAGVLPFTGGAAHEIGRAHV